MTHEAFDAIAIARANAELRQEEETFQQRKRHENTWFILRAVMGYTSIVLLAAIIVIAGYVLLNPKVYSATVLTSAGAALFVDVLGLLIGVWKIALKPDFISRLSPTTRTRLSVSAGTHVNPAESEPS